MRNYMSGIIVLCGIMVFACSKHQQPLSCESKTVQFALLDANKNNTSAPVYFSHNLSAFESMQNLDTSQTCSAILILQSNLNKENLLKLPVKYTVYRVNGTSLFSTSDLELDNASKAQMQSWLTNLNNFAGKLGDYQLTPYGALYVVKQSDIEQILYFNGKAVKPVISNYQINIEKNYTLGDKYIFLIGSYTGGTIDMDTKNNSLIQIDAQGRYKLTQAFAYRSEAGIIQNKDTSLYINGIDPGRPYVESADFPVYVYESGVLNTRHASKSDSYYMAKFSSMLPKNIIDLAKHDNCFDAEGNQVDVSHACGYAAKYCFMYKALANPPHDDYYVMLHQICD